MNIVAGKGGKNQASSGVVGCPGRLGGGERISPGGGTQFEGQGSARTLQRKRSTKTRLSPGESDRLARFARLIVGAEEAIGDRIKSLRWLTTPNRALEGERPLKLLDSDAGTLAVEQVLGRIEHGVFS